MGNGVFESSAPVEKLPAQFEGGVGEDAAWDPFGLRGHWRRRRSAAAWVLGVLGYGTGLALMGCGGPVYAIRAAHAATELARAEQLDAARRAPYEYYFALEHLEKAREEAARADYGDAIALAGVAFDYANRALQVAQRVTPTNTASASVPSP